MAATLTLRDRLKQHFDKFHTAPFLFVGSGISRRYLNLEDWDGLLRKFAQLCGSPYEYYYASANGVYPQVGTEIARALHPLWWKDRGFEESRAEFGKDAITIESAFKIEISKHLRDKHERLPTDGELLREVEALRKVVIDGVVTTNWDLLLDTLFPEFRVFVGQDDVLFSAPQGIGEIYKIHGSCSIPNSLVVTSVWPKTQNSRETRAFLRKTTAEEVRGRLSYRRRVAALSATEGLFFVGERSPGGRRRVRPPENLRQVRPPCALC